MALTEDMKQWAAEWRVRVRETIKERYLPDYDQDFDEYDMPICAITLRYKGDIVINEAWGSANVANTKPYTPYTPCQLRSTTKSFTGVMAIKLHEEGIIDLDSTMYDSNILSSTRPSNEERWSNSYTQGIYNDVNPNWFNSYQRDKYSLQLGLTPRHGVSHVQWTNAGWNNDSQFRSNVIGSDAVTYDSRPNTEIGCPSLIDYARWLHMLIGGWASEQDVLPVSQGGRGLSPDLKGEFGAPDSPHDGTGWPTAYNDKAHGFIAIYLEEKATLANRVGSYGRFKGKPCYRYMDMLQEMFDAMGMENSYTGVRIDPRSNRDYATQIDIVDDRDNWDISEMMMIDRAGFDSPDDNGMVLVLEQNLQGAGDPGSGGNAAGGANLYMNKMTSRVKDSPNDLERFKDSPNETKEDYSNRRWSYMDSPMTQWGPERGWKTNPVPQEPTQDYGDRYTLAFLGTDQTWPRPGAPEYQLYGLDPIRVMGYAGSWSCSYDMSLFIEKALQVGVYLTTEDSVNKVADYDQAGNYWGNSSLNPGWSDFNGQTSTQYRNAHQIPNNNNVNRPYRAWVIGGYLYKELDDSLGNTYTPFATEGAGGSGPGCISMGVKEVGLYGGCVKNAAVQWYDIKNPDFVAPGAIAAFAGSGVSGSVDEYDGIFNDLFRDFMETFAEPI